MATRPVRREKTCLVGEASSLSLRALRAGKLIPGASCGETPLGHYAAPLMTAAAVAEYLQVEIGFLYAHRQELGGRKLPGGPKADSVSPWPTWMPA